MRFAASIFLTALSALAQVPPNTNPKFPVPPALPPFQLPARVGVFSEMRLSLHDVIAMVLANNRDVELLRIDERRAGYNIIAARGAFDTRFGFDGTHTRQIVPVASVLGGAANGKLTETTLNVNPYVAGNSPWGGTEYRLDFNASKNSTNSSFATLNPQFPTAATLTLTQPLWRGLMFDANRYQVRVAQKNRAISAAQLRQHIADDITQAVQAYWELDYAYRNLQVQTEAVDLARQQDESNRRQVEQGILAAVDVVATHTQMATFEQNVYAAQEAVTRAENLLKTLILPDRHHPAWSSALIPATAAGEVQELDVRTAVDTALRQRPEIEQVKLSGEVNQLDVRLNRDEMRPQVNLVGSFAASGLAGFAVPQGPNPFAALIPGFSSAPPALLVGGFGQSLSNLYSGYFPTVQVGVRVSLPLRNRTAVANLESSIAAGQRIGVQRQQVEQAVEAEVRNTLQATESARARLQAAVLARESAEEQYQSEQRQFRAGTTSVFLVLQRQTDLIAARSRELRARADLNEAAPLRDRAIGATLGANNIVVQ